MARPRARRPSTIRGFSLLEILITTVVLSVAMMPLLLSISTSTRVLGATRDHLSAVAFAQRTLEDLRRASYRPTDAAGSPDPPSRVGDSPFSSLDDMVRSMNDPVEVDPRTGRGSRFMENGVTYTRALRLVPEVAQIDASGLPDVRVCSVTVTWKPSSAGRFQGEQTYQVFTAFGSAER